MPIRVAVGFLMAALLLSPPAAVGQRPAEIALADPQPHFVAAWAPKKPREAERSAVLVRRLSLELVDVTLDSALKELTAQAGLNITYSPAVLPAGRRVTIKAGDIAVVTALTEMLFRSGLDVVVDRDGMLALVVCRHPAPRAEILDSGTIVGTVTDKPTGTPIAGATIVVEGTSQSATTDIDGRYWISGVTPGTYTVRARYIGYAVLSTKVTVGAGEEVTADFGLEKLVQKLDELVTVTPGGLQTEVKALSSPVTVITAEEIQARRPKTFADVFRQTVPGAVAFDFSSPASTRFRLRGAATLSASFSTAKIFVDGLEVAAGEYSPIDPESIERVEVIRGPQASTIFGPDAAGGVIQVFTKRGGEFTRPELSLRTQVGIQQTPYAGFKSVLRQDHAASVRGSLGAASFNFGAGWSRLNDWVPPADNGTAQSTPSVYGGIGYETPGLGFDVSGRYSRPQVGIAPSPGFLSSGVGFLSRPDYMEDTFTSQSIGGRLRFSPLAWWTHQVTVGVGRLQEEAVSQRPRLTTPDDTTLAYFNQVRSRLSLYYNTSARITPLPSMTTTITAGVDYVRTPSDLVFGSALLSTSGQLQPAPGSGISVSREVAKNTGYFAQTELGLRDRLFLTLGLRADENPDFGTDVGTVTSPRAGVSYTAPVGTTSLKVRMAYGRAVRGIVPLRATGQNFGSSILLPNPLLRPERQRGWDAGLDVYGSTWNLSLTGYDQRARDLHQIILVTTDPVSTSQWQNVGLVRNRGVEVEVGVVLLAGHLRVRGQYSYTFSRIDSLGTATVGVDSVGERPSSTPTHTAGGGVTLQVQPGTMVDAGATYVGSFFNSDNVAFFKCLGGTGPCPTGPTTLRAFRREYPGFVKLNVKVSQDLARQIGVYVAVDNLTNNDASEFSSFVPVQGRFTALGVRIGL